MATSRKLRRRRKLPTFRCKRVCRFFHTVSRLTAGFTPGGEVPKAAELAALCYIIRHSSQLTPQQNELEATKKYLPGYKQDRELATKLAERLLTALLKQGLVDQGKLDEYENTVREATETEPNCQQRDIPEAGENLRSFYHDNEHEYRLTKNPKSPWVGVRPKIPSKGEKWADPELKAISDGEDFEEVVFGEREQPVDDSEVQSMDLDD